jgi:hypothetical protein
MRIKEKLNEFANPPPTETAHADVVPLGAFSDQLGGLLPGEEGPVSTAAWK